MPKRFKKSLDAEEGPETVMISPTDRCNLNCKMCWRQEKEKSPEEFEKGLELTLIKRIIANCKAMGVKSLDFTGGGEPFLREDLFEILKTSQDFHTSLTTNGTLLNDKRIRRVLEANLNEITFSLDSPQPQVNDYLRGEGTYQKTLTALTKLKRRKDEEGRKKPKIQLSSVITNKNLESLPSLVDLAADLGIKVITFSPLNEWASNRYLSPKHLGEKTIEASLEAIKQREKARDVTTNVSNLIQYGLFEHEPPKFCFAPWEMLFINAAGEVMVCCTLATFYQNIIGDVHDRNLQELWNSDALRQFRERINQREFFEDCKYCLPDFTNKYNRKLKEKLR